MSNRTTESWEALLEGTTTGPWEPFHDTWEDYGPDGEIIAEYEQSGVIGGADGILDTNPRKALMDAPNQWEDSGEHDNRANTRLAAAAPDAVSEVVRLRRELEQIRRECLASAKASEGNARTSNSWEALEAVAYMERDTAESITRILEGDTK